MDDSTAKLGFATRLVHSGEERHPFGSITTPVFDTASFVMPDFAAHSRAVRDMSGLPYYTRGYNPTVEALEGKLASIESAEAALAFSRDRKSVV